jgi:multidrug resistance efflux pump
MDKRWLLLPLLLAVLLVALRWSQTRTEPLRVSGFLEADEIRVGSRVGGRVAKVLVDEGSQVAGGALLAELEPFDLLERRAELAARVEELEARLAELRAGPRTQEIEAARAHLVAVRAAASLAELDEGRTRSLVEDSIRSKEALDRSQAVLESARADVRASEEALGLLEEGTRKEELAGAEARLESARSALRALERALDELLIRAPAADEGRAFTVEACALEPGDLVAANAAVVVLRDARELRVRAYVPQDRLVFPVGAPAWVGVDAHPERRFRARVDFIAPRAEFTPSNVQTPEERSEVVVRVRVTLEEGQELLRPGVAADVWFEDVRSEE